MEPDNQPASNTVSTNKNKNIVIAAGVVLLALGLYFLFKPTTEPEIENTNTEAKFKRDEPTKDQIFQEDYKEKIEEMIDSGKTVIEISKETGVRVDEVRKIKKQLKAKQDSSSK